LLHGYAAAITGTGCMYGMRGCVTVGEQREFALPRRDAHR
jgi:hypothetical protein